MRRRPLRIHLRPTPTHRAAGFLDRPNVPVAASERKNHSTMPRSNGGARIKGHIVPNVSLVVGWSGSGGCARERPACRSVDLTRAQHRRRRWQSIRPSHRRQRSRGLDRRQRSGWLPGWCAFVRAPLRRPRHRPRRWIAAPRRLITFTGKGGMAGSGAAATATAHHPRPSLSDHHPTPSTGEKESFGGYPFHNAS
jgi:hypothetical protein